MEKQKRKTMGNRKRTRLSKIEFSLIVLLLLSSLCFSQNRKPISLKKDLVIGDENSEDLFQWAGVCSDKAGNIYVTDMMDYSIKKFDKNGNFIKKTGRKGKGPGEFWAIRLIATYDSLLYVTDQYISGIQVFDLNLNYKSHINYDFPILDLQLLSPNSLIISSISKRDVGKLIWIDSLRNRFSIPYSNNSSDMMESVKFNYINDNCIYIAFMWRDCIEKINAKGKIIWKKSLFGDKSSKRKTIKGFSIPTDIFYKDIACDTAGHVFVLGGNLSKNKSRDVYVFDSNGEQINTITLNESTHCIYIDDNNYLYSRANLGTSLVRYKIIYK